MGFKIATEAALLGESKLGNVKFKKQNDGFTPSSQAQKGAVIEFIPMHFKNTPVIKFIAFIDDIKDNIKQDFTPQQPFGRTDPIQIWKSSSRDISLNFKILSSDEEMALRNLNNLSWLIASSYPTYEKSQCANSLAASPLYRVKLGNLIANVHNRAGLLCAINGFNVSHDLKGGVIHIHSTKAKNLADGAGFPTQAQEILVAKTITVSCQLNVLHEHSLGWDSTTGEWRGGSKQGYPYGFGVIKDAGTPGSAGAGGTATSTDASVAAATNGASTAARQEGAAIAKNLGAKIKSPK